ncbi:rifin [Plasmodium reichenowi]|uniref:Rifin n=1 Tax=Plasmodium reichenowi TaxID=5854 RepID=A0A060RLW3_PLARE|nr:rifin [Plasmodium reichenowi]
MKLHFSKILLFILALNILVTSSSSVYTKNKPYITPHHTQTNRSLRECDTQSSIYDKDVEIKSVKDIFDRKTSQRFEEYEERMKDKRQKRKEERDENIKKIIEKDKMDKSFAEKVEKGCLKCGCGLGGVAASVGLFGGLGIYGWKSAALATAKEAAEKFGAAQGAIAGAEEGVKVVIAGIKDLGELFLDGKPLESFIDVTKYMKVSFISDNVYSNYSTICLPSRSASGVPSLGNLNHAICKLVRPNTQGTLNRDAVKALIEAKVKEIVTQGTQAASDKAAGVAATKTAEAIKTSTDAIEATSTHLYSAIGYSILAILIIVLVMIIIYLVLRYRRKKKMKKKAQYTKLLNE